MSAHSCLFGASPRRTACLLRAGREDAAGQALLWRRPWGLRAPFPGRSPRGAPVTPGPLPLTPAAQPFLGASLNRPRLPTGAKPATSVDPWGVPTGAGARSVPKGSDPWAAPQQPAPSAGKAADPWAAASAAKPASPSGEPPAPGPSASVWGGGGGAGAAESPALRGEAPPGAHPAHPGTPHPRCPPTLRVLPREGYRRRPTSGPPRWGSTWQRSGDTAQPLPLSPQGLLISSVI